MRRLIGHGAICAGALLALQAEQPLPAAPPRPIPLATSSGDPRLPKTATPTSSPAQGQTPFSLWADVLGLNSPQPTASKTQSTQPRAPALPVSSNVRWEVMGRSVEGRVIEFAQFGDGPHQVLVIGALDGDKPEGVAMAEFLAGHLSRFPKRLSDVTVTIVRDPNPDGRAKRTAANARGVLLDRNFNTPGWQKQANGTGPQPESEPETRGLAEMLLDVQPERVILFSTAAGQASLAFSGPDEPLARQVAVEANAQLQNADTLRQPGSLASYTGDDRGIPTIRMGFVPQANADSMWADHKRAILTAIGCGSPLDFMPVVTRYGPRKPRQATGVAPAVPVQPLPGAVEPPPIADTVSAPVVLRFESVKQGLPTVRIDRTRIISGPRSAFDEPAFVASPPLAAPTTLPNSPMRNVNVNTTIQRLPPVDSLTIQRTPPLTPSQPIVAYPGTGR